MSVVTTYNLLPSVRAPLEGESVLLLGGGRATVFAPLAYVPQLDGWKVHVRERVATVYMVRDGIGWREV